MIVHKSSAGIHSRCNQKSLQIEMNKRIRPTPRAQSSVKTESLRFMIAMHVHNVPNGSHNPSIRPSPGKFATCMMSYFDSHNGNFWRTGAPEITCNQERIRIPIQPIRATNRITDRSALPILFHPHSSAYRKRVYSPFNCAT